MIRNVNKAIYDDSDWKLRNSNILCNLIFLSLIVEWNHENASAYNVVTQTKYALAIIDSCLLGNN